VTGATLTDIRANEHMEDTPDELPFSLDEIGPWSETKLEIIRKYAGAFSDILAKQPGMSFSYIDGFAGAGLHKRKGTGQELAGSPLNVVSINPRFREYHLVELDAKKVAHLRKLFKTETTVHVHQGDCNQLLVSELLPKVQWKEFKRAFCLLDPYCA
jgi:three-Cys-motif partner protein